MKIIITAEEQIDIAVERKNEEEIISIPAIVAVLELAKSLTVERWKEMLSQEQGDKADVEDHQASRSN